MRNVYLDYAAATPVDTQVLAAMQPYFAEQFANPSSLYAAARETRQALEGARAEVADCLGAKPTEIIFTAGATESINLALQGVARAWPKAHIITTAIEHEAVLQTARALAAGGHDLTVVPVAPSGLVSVADIAAAVRDTTVLISVMMANNEVGTIQPLKELGQAVAQLRAERQAAGNPLPLYLHSDAAQAATTLDVHVARLGVDLLTLNGGKMYGPKQSGILYVRTGTKLEPLLYGGGQERALRSGTENVAACVGLARALRLAQSSRKTEAERLQALRDELWGRLQTALPDIELNGDAHHRLAGNLNVTIPDVEGEELVLYLDKAGIQASTGSACSIASSEPSHVLLALGRTAAQANASLRLTLGRPTTSDDVEYAASQIIQTVQHLRSR